MDERSAWIALASVDGIGELTFALLLEEFGSASEALAAATDHRLGHWMAKRRALDGRPPLNSPTLAGLRVVASDPRVPLDELAQRGLWTLTPLDKDYPRRLRDLDPPPATINGLGDADALRAETCGRGRGHENANRRRPDACRAHRDSSGRMRRRRRVGAGDRHRRRRPRGDARRRWHHCRCHRRRARLARAHGHTRDCATRSSAKGGAVISEYRPTAAPRKGTFPRRNRIIAALADATVVVEAPVRSGALNTAGHASKLGRPVLVAPGRIGDWATAGCLGLLHETPAQPLVGLDEMVEDLGLLRPVGRTRMT